MVEKAFDAVRIRTLSVVLLHDSASARNRLTESCAETLHLFFVGAAVRPLSSSCTCLASQDDRGPGTRSSVTRRSSGRALSTPSTPRCESQRCTPPDGKHTATATPNDRNLGPDRRPLPGRHAKRRRRDARGHRHRGRDRDDRRSTSTRIPHREDRKAPKGSFCS